MSRLVLSAITFLLANNAMAILPSTIQPNEFPALPAYCEAKLSNDPSDDKAYSGMIGPDWLHIHHYCFALNFTNRFYKASNPEDKRHYLQDAFGNHDYVLSHARADFWMRPEIHTEKAKLYRASKRYAETVGELKKALQIKPDYAGAYVVLSDVYRDLNKKSDSISVVEKGLQYAPYNKPLQRRYKSLTGKDFTPPPVTQVLGDDEIKSQTPSGNKEPNLAGDAEVNANAPAFENVEPQAPSQSTPSEIGSPTNPYCRFCP